MDRLERSPADGVAKAARYVSPSKGDDVVEVMEVGDAEAEKGNMIIENIMRTMMSDMKEMKTMMTRSEKIAEEAREEARFAKQAAFEAKMSVTSVAKDVQCIKDNMVTKELMEKRIKATAKVTTEDEISQKIEAALSKMNVSHNKSKEGKDMNDSTVLVVGRLKQNSFQAAVDWIKNIVNPKDIYKKGREGEEFKGLVFMKFHTAMEASMGMRTLRTKVVEEDAGKPSTERIWCDVEAPIDVRVCLGFLRGFRGQRMEWKFPSASVKMDTETCSLKVEGKMVVQAKVISDKFQVEWINAEWARWGELHQSPELAVIRKNARERLANSRERVSKGAGKGLPK